jgi:hypothetical protein
MIRSAATSIGLSQSDIDFHFCEIEIKEQLYAQGFTRKEVQRYYRERLGHINGSDAEDDDLATRTTSANFTTAREELGLPPEIVQQGGGKRTPSGM